MTPDLHPTAQRVQDALRAAGSTGEVVPMTVPTPTAVAAAEALGVELGQIANSLVFDVDGAAVLVMSSGANRVDLAKLSALAGGSAKRASPELVRAATGFAIGGVPPVGFPAPLRAFVDRDRATYGEVWAAGGTPDTLFATTADELVRLTGGTLADTAVNPG